jgi:uncharacterized protein (DUF1330 family)
MNENSGYALATTIIGALIGFAAGQLFCAQVKPNAHSVAELQILDNEAQAAYILAAGKAVRAAHAVPLQMGGRAVGMQDAAAPGSVAIIEWNSLDDAVAFYKTKAWTNLAPQADKGEKTIITYAVEIEK